MNDYYNFYNLYVEQQDTNTKLDSIIDRLDTIEQVVASGDQDIINAIDSQKSYLDYSLGCLILITAICFGLLFSKF